MIKKFILACIVAFPATAAVQAQDLENMVIQDVENALLEAEFEEEGDLIPAPNFTLKDLEGKDVTLTDFQGSWVVLDFWGAWCKWCIKGIPEMKEAYAKYHADGLEIIGIDCGDTPSVWKTAVAQYGLPWVNVYNPEGSALTDTYGIQGFPTKIIVNPEGYIYEVVIGEDPEFYTLLSQLFM